LKKRIHDLEREVRSLRNVEQTLRETKDFLETLINHIPNQVFWKNEKLEYMGCNRHFSRVVGLDDSECIVGMTDYDFDRDASHAESYRLIHRPTQTTRRRTSG
jgi:PAS domain-containing protein